MLPSFCLGLLLCLPLQIHGITGLYLDAWIYIVVIYQLRGTWETKDNTLKYNFNWKITNIQIPLCINILTPYIILTL